MKLHRYLIDDYLIENGQKLKKKDVVIVLLGVLIDI
jgi:hypothetical protein